MTVDGAVEETIDDHNNNGQDTDLSESNIAVSSDKGTPAEEERLQLALTEQSSSSSQLLSGPASTSGSAHQNGVRSPVLSIETSLSNDESYFILDEGGRHVLNNQGSPAKARKWQPTNANQRKRYTRLHLATKGPAPTCRWLHSVLVSPDHLNIPAAREAQRHNTVKGACLGAINAYSTAGYGKLSSLLAGADHSTIRPEDLCGADRRQMIEVAKQRRRFLAEERRRNRPKQLDGFTLMDACGCELPDEGRRADVSGRGLIGVVQEDLSYFVRLQAVDAGDNSMPFESFARLPRLEELRMPCNNISDISVGRRSYCELQRLDLSYNHLSGDALSAIGKLPSLVDLDLTCNGLTELPKALGHLQQLQKLTLERNQLESDSVIDVLSNLPALRELNLAFNYFTGIYFTPESAEYAFPLLESLNLGFNYIAHETDVERLVLLERLQRIILYGNPLAGPSGEDSLGLCVQALMDKADRIREGWANNPIEVITELPRKQRSRPGVGEGGSGRRRPYSDIGVTMVDEGRLPSAVDFRTAGNEIIFRFESRERWPTDAGGVWDMNQRQQTPPEGIVEPTSRAARNSCQRRTPEKRQPVGREKDGTFLTGVERQEDNDVEDGEPILGEGEESNGGLDSGSGGGQMAARLLRGPVDPVVRGDPVKLKMALKALRYTLNHPVTSSMDVPLEIGRVAVSRATGGNGTNIGIGRKTAAARARQLPRRPYQLLKLQHEGAGGGGFGKPAGLGIMAENGSCTKMAGDLDKVDALLSSMGIGFDEMTLENRAAEKEAAVRAAGRPGLSSIIRTVNALLDENEN